MTTAADPATSETVVGRPPHQAMPDLTPTEYEALREDIRERGVLVPVEVCAETGAILDGHHRVRVCEELGITGYPRVVRAGLTHDERLAHALALNVARRHLTPQARAEAVAALRRQGWSSRRISRATGVSQSTAIRDIRAAESSDSADTKIVGSDGKRYAARRKPVSKPSVYASTAREQQRAKDALTALGQDAPAKTLDLRRAERLTRDKRSAARRSEPPPTLPNTVRIDHCDFRALDVAPASVDAVVTDPPYTAQSIRDGIWDDLAVFAARVLRPGGYLAAVSGQMYLPQILTALCEHLTYHWTVAICHAGTGTAYVRPREVLNGWKPVVVFRASTDAGTDPAAARSPLVDVIRGTGRSKDNGHPWEQPVSEAADLITALSPQGGMVVDPFVGSGTVAVAAVRLGRHLIGCDVDGQHVLTARQRVADEIAAPAEGD